ARKRDWACPLGPDRVEENTFAARLDQKRRVPDVGDAQPRAVEVRRRAVLRKGAGNAARPRLAPVTQLPFQECAGPTRLHAARVEKAHAVEMIGCGAVVVGVGATARQQRPSAGADGCEGAQGLQKAATTWHQAPPGLKSW